MPPPVRRRRRDAFVILTELNEEFLLHSLEECMRTHFSNIISYHIRRIVSRASYLLHGNAGGFAGLRCPDSCSACAILTAGGMVQGLVVACYIWIHALVSRCV